MISGAYSENSKPPYMLNNPFQHPFLAQYPYVFFIVSHDPCMHKPYILPHGIISTE